MKITHEWDLSNSDDDEEYMEYNKIMTTKQKIVKIRRLLIDAFGDFEEDEIPSAIKKILKEIQEI